MTHFNCSHDASWNASSLESVLKCQCIDDCGKHSHIITLGPIHALACPAQTPKDIAAADNHCYLNSVVANFRQFDCGRREGRSINGKPALAAGQSFTTEFDDHPFELKFRFGFGHGRRANWGRRELQPRYDGRRMRRQ